VGHISQTAWPSKNWASLHRGGDHICRHGLGAYPILLYGSEDLKRKYLPQIASGKRLAAFGLTEPNAGSDVSGIQTTAVRDGDHYILNGSKQWITNGGEAEIYSVLAITDRSKGPRGGSFFVVETEIRDSRSGRRKKSSVSAHRQPEN